MTLNGHSGYLGLRDALIFTITFTLFPVVFYRYAKSYLMIIGSILFFTSLIHLEYFFIFNQEISQSIFYIIFETNHTEGFEFVGNYINWKLLVFIPLYALVPVFLYKKINNIKYNSSFIAVITLLVIGVNIQPYFKKYAGFSVATIDAGTSRLMEKYTTIPLMQYLLGYYEYKNQLNIINKLIASINSKNIESEAKIADTEKKQTYIIVIGESTNRGRMGLYGYARDTSPLLNKIKNELLVFNDVITPKPSTIEALSLVLTFDANGKHDFYPNLITMMKDVGFKTFWISNQQTISNSNSLLTAYSKLADERYYLNQNRNQSSVSYDEKVLEPLENVLSDTADKKLIVVHLLGTHGQYRFRYPKQYSIFNDANIASPWAKLSQDRLDYYNEYDNAVLYNDYVMYKIISVFKESDDYGALVYFSDHGEEVFDVKDFHGRNELEPTQAMYTVPFFIWANDKYKSNYVFWQNKAMLDRPYSTINFMNTLCELAHIEYKYCDYNKSVIHDHVINERRIIGDLRIKPLDYDSYFS